MDGFSVLIGGKAGFGIDRSSSVIGSILNKLCWRIFISRDYPSLIRGGHTFSVIRASKERVAACYSKIDFLLALNQDSINLHKDRLKEGSLIIYDSDSVKIEGLKDGIDAAGLAVNAIIKEENAPEIMRNTCVIGAFAKAIGLEWSILEAVFRKEITKDAELNLKVAKRGYDQSKELRPLEPLSCLELSVLSGNQAVGLGLIKAGLKVYLAYPMTPSSPILHFLAEVAEDFALKVIHPESEIGVILMAMGFSYAGEKVAVGTSGGGFCLMTEGLSFAGMSELPIVIILGQRPGPSTGLPTYSAQTELFFALNAGQGEFSRFTVAPGDAEEAYYWSGVSLNMAWKYQLPAIVLTDKDMGESAYNFDLNCIDRLKEEVPLQWDKQGEYRRYLNTENGVSPLAFAPEKGSAIKVNSYEHDEAGITTEDPKITTLMQDKRLRKARYLLEDLEGYDTVGVYGNPASDVALLCWGSNKGVCLEAAQRFNIKVIQPRVLEPFPVNKFRQALQGVKKTICIEGNATAQLARLIGMYGFKADDKILKYDGRPFYLDEMEEILSTKIKA